MNFREKLLSRCDATGSPLCVGIDPDPSKIPPHLLEDHDLPAAVEAFCKQIIESTAEFAASFKFNLAFFEALGNRGPAVLGRLVRDVPPGVVTIADAKRGDIGNSARFYAVSIFEDLPFDSITVSPYMGKDSVSPFLAYPGRAAFVLVRTSNPGGSDFQLLDSGGQPLYRLVANAVLEWDSEAAGTAGFVVGATDLSALRDLRVMAPDTPFLIPGVGAQGASAEDVMSAAGSGPLLVNSSRQILYASTDRDFASASAAAARSLQKQLRF